MLYIWGGEGARLLYEWGLYEIKKELLNLIVKGRVCLAFVKIYNFTTMEAWSQYVPLTRAVTRPFLPWQKQIPTASAK